MYSLSISYLIDISIVTQNSFKLFKGDNTDKTIFSLYKKTKHSYFQSYEIEEKLLVFLNSL